MKKNILLIYLHTFLSTFILFYICDTLFYIERGLSSSQYISFVGIAFLVKLIFEIPFGILADKYSKKKLLLISNVLFILSTVIFIYSHNYFTFLIAIIISAINNSISSGIVNSILYESIENKKDFNKILFYNSFFYNVSYMIAMIIGGYIGQHFGLIYNYYFTIIPFIIDFFILLIIKVNKPAKDNVNNNLIILKNGAKEVLKNPYLLKLILTSSILFSGIKLVEESHPEYSANIGISVFIIGIYTAFILVFCIIGSYLGSKVNREKYTLVLKVHPILSGICILLIGILNNYLGIVFILLIYIFSESFNNISSKSRVTAESINQFVLGIFGFLFSMLMTVLLKYMSVSSMYIVIGSIIVICSLLNILMTKLKKHN